MNEINTTPLDALTMQTVYCANVYNEKEDRAQLIYEHASGTFLAQTFLRECARHTRRFHWVPLCKLRQRWAPPHRVYKVVRTPQPSLANIE